MMEFWKSVSPTWIEIFKLADGANVELRITYEAFATASSCQLPVNLESVYCSLILPDKVYHVVSVLLNMYDLYFT